MYVWLFGIWDMVKDHSLKCCLLSINSQNWTWCIMILSSILYQQTKWAWCIVYSVSVKSELDVLSIPYQQSKWDWCIIYSVSDKLCLMYYDIFPINSQNWACCNIYSLSTVKIERDVLLSILYEQSKWAWCIIHSLSTVKTEQAIGLQILWENLFRNTLETILRFHEKTCHVNQFLIP